MDYDSGMLIVWVRGKDIGDITVAFSTCAGAALACRLRFITFNSSDSRYIY